MRIREADLEAAPVRALITAHLTDMHAGSPPESVHALGLEALGAPDITVWAAEAEDGRLAGISALRRLDAERAEIKSMRVDDAFRGTGVGRALLRHLVAEARARGVRSMWLETGAQESFAPARGLYASEGFTVCGPFGDYTDDPLSVYMTRML